MKRMTRWMALAVMAGFLGMAGAASAYEMGDFTDDATPSAVGSENVGSGINGGKLIPYYMAGDNLATIIGVQNEAVRAKNTTDVSVIEVAVFNKMGVFQAQGRLCLAPMQFGYATLTEKMMDGMAMDDMDMADDMDMKYTMVVLTVGAGGVEKTITGPTGTADDTAGTGVAPGKDKKIAAMGYVVLTDLGIYTKPGTPSPTDQTDDGCNSTGNPVPRGDNNDSRFTAWTILQDVGGEAFGTEIPTLTVDTTAPLLGTNAAADRLDCDPVTNCRGLIAPGISDTANKVTVRFDNDMDNLSESMIYLWANNQVAFRDNSGVRVDRKIKAEVYCEEATAKKDMFLNIPDRVNVIDGDMLECEARGTAVLTMLLDDGTVSTDAVGGNIGTAGVPGAVAIWSHVAQDGGGFRMNFLGME